jgi:hypothetical protein
VGSIGREFLCAFLPRRARALPGRQSRALFVMNEATDAEWRRITGRRGRRDCAASAANRVAATAATAAKGWPLDILGGRPA